jgi:hypothetical protein
MLPELWTKIVLYVDVERIKDWFWTRFGPMSRDVPMNLTKRRVVASMILLFVEHFSVALRIGTNEEWFWSFLNVLAEFVLRLGVFKNQTSRKTSKSRVHKFVKTLSASIIGDGGVIFLSPNTFVGE